MSVFAPSGPSPLSTVSLQGATSPTVANVTVTLANTEQSYTLPPLTKRFVVQARGVTTTKIAFTSGASGTTYLTIGAGAYYQETDISLAGGLTVYFQTTKPSQVIEIVSWQ